MQRYFEKNNLSLNKILNNLFNKKIKRMRYLGCNKLAKMPEYKFNLLKFNVILEDYSNYSVFIKIINEEQIEESLFCYWFFCEENYSFNTKFHAPKANIINYEKRSYERKYKLQILSDNPEIFKSTFIDFININQYKNTNLKKRKRNSLEQTNKFLFVAIL
ncbi:MAG: hypothetical protein IKF38_06400 [Clostridia bacterium]|nr:hypothetical protein [Clostridia bacterium]